MRDIEGVIPAGHCPLQHRCRDQILSSIIEGELKSIVKNTQRSKDFSCLGVKAGMNFASFKHS